MNDQVCTCCGREGAIGRYCNSCDAVAPNPPPQARVDASIQLLTDAAAMAKEISDMDHHAAQFYGSMSRWLERQAANTPRYGPDQQALEFARLLVDPA